MKTRKIKRWDVFDAPATPLRYGAEGRELDADERRLLQQWLDERRRRRERAKQ